MHVITMSSVVETITRMHASHAARDLFIGKRSANMMVRYAFNHTLMPLKEGDDWVDIHYSDFVSNPSIELNKLCSALSIDCPDEYLSKVHALTAKLNISHSVDKIKWVPHIARQIDTAIRNCHLFSRSDIFRSQEYASH